MLNSPITPQREPARRKRRLTPLQEGMLAGTLVALVALGGAIYTQSSTPTTMLDPPAAMVSPAASPAEISTVQRLKLDYF